MSLFGFGNIEFGPDGREDTFGPLAVLESDEEFKRENFRYPSDVGAFDKGHYMMFYIRKQRKTGFTGLTEDTSVAFPGQSPNGTAAGTRDYMNSITGSEIGSKITSGVNQIKSATGDLGSSFTSKISSFTGAGGKLGGFDTSSVGMFSSFGDKVKGGVNNLMGQTSLLKANSTSSNKILNHSISSISKEGQFINTTSRTTENIALYMPDTLMYNHTQTYSSVSMGKGPVAAIMAAGKSALDEYKLTSDTTVSGAVSAVSKALAKGGSLDTLRDAGAIAGVSAITSAAGLNGAASAQALIGQIQNPLLEMAYTSPNFRKFQFDFFFYPRDETEALEVQNILDRFKYHQAPEHGTGENQTKAATLRPPSEFDIKFYYGAGENPNIPALAEGCVLETIDVNYAPNGASFYEVPGENIATRGRTGMPVGVQLTLNFAETKILTKNDLKNPKTGGKL